MFGYGRFQPNGFGEEQVLCFADPLQMRSKVLNLANLVVDLDTNLRRPIGGSFLVQPCKSEPVLPGSILVDFPFTELRFVRFFTGEG